MIDPEIDEDGNRYWSNADGALHREDGPATIWPDGSEFWYKNGKAHRTNGPAVVYFDFFKEYYIDGEQYHNNHSYQKAADISDEDMLAIVLKYGNVK